MTNKDRPAGTYYAVRYESGHCVVKVQTDKTVFGIRMSDLVCMMPYQGDHYEMAERIADSLNNPNPTSP
jgi:hypothetical protein